MMRLFVGLDFPDRVRNRLGLLQAGVPGARWVDPDNLHVTLAFIGEADEDQAQALDAELARVQAPAFDLVLAGMGVFGAGGRKPRSLWVGVEKSEPLRLLQGRVEAAMVRAGLTPEARKFTPHVTLARLKDSPAGRLGAYLAGNGLFREGPIAMADFVLFESVLGREGAHYTALVRYRLEPRSS
ncbi:MAG: RNA 2',3'-cyclic phosphodiesterase [Rhodospirillales bacterium]|nr:RNA 2',3'-cyclic phosphodiesterase [Rhodospirillales bacterium]